VRNATGSGDWRERCIVNPPVIALTGQLWRLQNRYDFAEYRDVTGYSEHAQWIQQSARITFILAGKLLFIMQR
jgi:hypothetical protein